MHNLKDIEGGECQLGGFTVVDTRYPTREMAQEGAEFQWSYATDIDENGTMVGYGSISGVGPVPLVWTPVPEPGGWAVLGLGLFIILLRTKEAHKSGGRIDAP